MSGPVLRAISSPLAWQRRIRRYAPSVTNKTFLAAMAVALVSASAALAQTGGQNGSTQTLPDLDNFSLPSSRPTPRRAPDPEPTVRPSTAATPRVAVPAAVPTVRTMPAPRAAPSVRPAPVPRGTPSPARPSVPRPFASPALARPVPLPQPVPSPTVAPTPAASPLPEAVVPTPESVSPQPVAPTTPQPAAASAGVPLWIWLTLACMLLALAIGSSGWWRPRIARRRGEDRRDAPDREIFVSTEAEAPPPTTLPPTAPPAGPATAPRTISPAPWLTGDRAMLDLELIPNRAGTDPAGLTVEYLLVLRNTGKAPASGIRLDVRLLCAGPRQDALIAALFDMPVAAPIAPPFDLAAGSVVEFGGTATHPRDTLAAMTLAGFEAGRAVVVPVLAVNVHYDWPGGRGQTAQSYVIGIARGAEAKLQPFPLDGPARRHESVSALDYPVRVVS